MSGGVAAPPMVELSAATSAPHRLIERVMANGPRWAILNHHRGRTGWTATELDLLSRRDVAKHPTPRLTAENPC